MLTYAVVSIWPTNSIKQLNPKHIESRLCQPSVEILFLPFTSQFMETWPNIFTYRTPR